MPGSWEAGGQLQLSASATHSCSHLAGWLGEEVSVTKLQCGAAFAFTPAAAVAAAVLLAAAAAAKPAVVGRGLELVAHQPLQLMGLSPAQ